MPIFMQIPNVIGGSLNPKYLNWIELDSLDWDASSVISPTNGTVTSVTVSTISCFCPHFANVNALAFAATTGYLFAPQANGPQVLVALTDFVGGVEIEPVRYTLGRVQVSKFAFSTGGDRPVVNFELVATRGNYLSRTYNPDGSVRNSRTFSFDLAQNRFTLNPALP